MSTLKKKYLIIFRNLITIVALFVSMFIVWQYQNDQVGKNITMFRFSVVSAIYFPFFFIISVLTKETVAKGGVISKSDLPFLYYIALFITLLMCLTSIIGVIYYWKR